MNQIMGGEGFCKMGDSPHLRVFEGRGQKISGAYAPDPPYLCSPGYANVEKRRHSAFKRYKKGHI